MMVLLRILRGAQAFVLVSMLGLALGCAAESSSIGADSVSATRAAADQGPAAVFQEENELLRPRGYREWVFVGAPVTPNDMNKGKAAFPEFHSVYIDSGSYEAYKRNGTWRNGTVMVKELSMVGAKAATSGKGYFMGDFSGLEVAVKDDQRFPDEPSGWAFFRFTNEEGGPLAKSAAPLPTSACASCHQAAAEDDLVFTQYYPVLRAAKSYGPGSPEDG